MNGECVDMYDLNCYGLYSHVLSKGTVIRTGPTGPDGTISSLCIDLLPAEIVGENNDRKMI